MEGIVLHSSVTRVGEPPERDTVGCGLAPTERCDEVHRVELRLIELPGCKAELPKSRLRETAVPLTLKDPAGAKRDAVRDMLKKICPEADIQVADNGTVSAKDANFCKREDPPLKGSCKCVCRAIASTRTITISVADDLSATGGGRTTFPNDDNFKNGTGSDADIQVENKDRWRLDKKDQHGEWIDDPDWIILAHELCGHAVPVTAGTHPESRPGKPGYTRSWHDDAVQKENGTRSDRGIPDRPLDADVVKK
jgi:hypothetical protein